MVVKELVNKMHTSEKVRINNIIHDMIKHYSITIRITPSKAWRAKEISKGIVKGDIYRKYAII